MTGSGNPPSAQCSDRIALRFYRRNGLWAVKKNAECEIIIKVETGTTSTGKASYSSRSFGYINPSLAEDDILDIGQKIAGLQKYNLGSVNRQDTAEIAAE